MDDDVPVNSTTTTTAIASSSSLSQRPPRKSVFLGVFALSRPGSYDAAQAKYKAKQKAEKQQKQELARARAKQTTFASQRLHVKRKHDAGDDTDSTSSRVCIDLATRVSSLNPGSPRNLRLMLPGLLQQQARIRVRARQHALLLNHLHLKALTAATSVRRSSRAAHPRQTILSAFFRGMNERGALQGHQMSILLLPTTMFPLDSQLICTRRRQCEAIRSPFKQMLAKKDTRCTLG